MLKKTDGDTDRCKNVLMHQNYVMWTEWQIGNGEGRG